MVDRGVNKDVREGRGADYHKEHWFDRPWDYRTKLKGKVNGGTGWQGNGKEWPNFRWINQERKIGLEQRNSQFFWKHWGICKKAGEKNRTELTEKRGQRIGSLRQRILLNERALEGG